MSSVVVQMVPDKRTFSKSIVLGKRWVFYSDWISINYSALSSNKWHDCYRSRGSGGPDQGPSWLSTGGARKTDRAHLWHACHHIHKCMIHNLSNPFLSTLLTLKHIYPLYNPVSGGVFFSYGGQSENQICLFFLFRSIFGSTPCSHGHINFYLQIEQ